MKSIHNIIMFQNLQADVWGYATNLLDLLQWFDGKDATDKAITSGSLVNDAIDRFVMWGTLVNEHYKIWIDWLNEIDLESVDRELFDDCPDNTTLTNRLRIVKLRAGDMWGENEYQTLFHEVLHSFKRLKSIVFATYEIDEPQAYKTAKQIHDNLTQKLIDIKRLQDYVQTIISKAENLLNPQLNSITEQERPKPITQSSILEDPEIKAVLQAVEESGLCVQRDGLYYWTGDNVLLSYLCSQISQYKDYSRQMRGDDYLPDWTKFEGIFNARGRKKWEWVKVSSLKLADYKKGYMRNHNEFTPDGSKDIDRIIGSTIKI